MSDETPQPTSPKQLSANQKARWGCAVLFVVIVLWAIIASALKGDKADSGPSDVGAADVCHQSVENQLKAPSTADYSQEKITHTGNSYTVSGVVDAENSFGAKLRNHFVCTATFVGGTNWNPVSAVVLPG